MAASLLASSPRSCEGGVTSIKVTVASFPHSLKSAAAAAVQVLVVDLLPLWSRRRGSAWRTGGRERGTGDGSGGNGVAGVGNGGKSNEKDS